MKKLFTGLLLTASLLGTVQSAQAAWVVGVASSGDHSEFGRSVSRMTYRTAMVSGILGLMTGNPIFATIFTLNDESSTTFIKSDLEARYPSLKGSEILTDLADLAATADMNGNSLDSIKTEDGVVFKRYSVQLNHDELSELLSLHGLDAKSPDVRKLQEDLTTDLK